MKVLMFGWEFPPHISGGLGTACYGLTKGLAAFDDIDLTFVVPKVYGNENKVKMKLIGASDVILSNKILLKQKSLEMKEHTDFDQNISSYITPGQYEKLLLEQKEEVKDKAAHSPSGKLELSGRYGISLFKEISRYGVVASEIAKTEPHDVIHVHDWLTYPAGIEAKKISGKPLVVHVHATEYDRCGENHNKNVHEIERRGMEFADKVITVSDLTRNIVISKYSISPLKVVTIHNGVEPANNGIIQNIWKRGTKDKIVTFLGRITWQKGPKYFIKAAYKVLQKMDNVRFVMAGSGDLMEEMVKYVAKLKIADKFHFTGFLKGDDVYRMFALSDLYIMPSVSEPFGISPLEASQSNVPVIISRQSGVSEVITYAIKVDYWDIDAISDAIYGILTYPSLEKHLKQNGKDEVNNLRWTDVAIKVKEIYYQVVYKKVG
jgi:glycosyltransferase involved in cell wall biosynthesis